MDARELETIAQRSDYYSNGVRAFSNDPDTLIERLREDYVSLMQEEAKSFNSLTQVSHDMDSQSQALEAQAEEYKQSQADLLSAQEVASLAQKLIKQLKQVFKGLLATYKGKRLQSYQAIDKDYQRGPKENV